MKRTSRTTAALLAATLTAPIAARADNQMGYRLETPQMAAALPRGGGSLGMRASNGRQGGDVTRASSFVAQAV